MGLVKFAKAGPVFFNKNKMWFLCFFGGCHVGIVDRQKEKKEKEGEEGKEEDVGKRQFRRRKSRYNGNEHKMWIHKKWTTWMRTTKDKKQQKREDNDKWKWEEKETYNQEKRQHFRREDNNNKRITKIRNIELRATSIGPKPFLFFGVSFMLKAVFPWKRRYFCLLFSVSLPFLLPTLTHFPFSLFLALLLFSCFLPSLFAFFFPSLFFLGFLALFLCFCFMQRRTSKYYIWKVLLINVYFVWLVPVSV